MIELTDPVALTQALIRCPSITPEDAGALDVVEDVLARLGFRCHRLTFATAGLAHAASPDLVFDAGLRLGLLGDAPDLQLLVGLTYNLGRVVRAPR